jgi:hypothetical protein
MSNRNFDGSTIIKILKAQNTANFYNRQNQIVAGINTVPAQVEIQPANPQTENFDAEIISTIRAGQQAYYFKNFPIVTSIDPINYVPMINNTGGPTYETYYVSFTTTGSDTWTAPTTIQSPITYWIVGGGGGGGGAHDNGSAGGGGGGAAITGTYAIVAGTTYSLVVGAGGAGGTGITGNVPPETDGSGGIASSFDVGNGGPVAPGGEGGFKSRGLPQNGIGGAAATDVSGGGGGRGQSSAGAGGGGGGAAASGTNGTAGSPGTAGTGGTGISFTIPGYNGGNSQSYGNGGNGGVNRTTVVGTSGSANTGNGGGGGGAAGGSPPTSIRMGGNGGSGLVIIQYSA